MDYIRHKKEKRRLSKRVYVSLLDLGVKARSRKKAEDSTNTDLRLQRIISKCLNVYQTGRNQVILFPLAG